MSELSPRMRALCAEISPLVDEMLRVWSVDLNRQQPISAAVVEVVNELLHEARRVLSREPGVELVRPLPQQGTVMAADGFIRLLQVRERLDQLVERDGEFDARGNVVWRERGSE